MYSLPKVLVQREVRGEMKERMVKDELPHFTGYFSSWKLKTG